MDDLDDDFFFDDTPFVKFTAQLSPEEELDAFNFDQAVFDNLTGFMGDISSEENGASYDIDTEDMIVDGSTESELVNRQCILFNWPYDKNTGKKLAYGTTGTHVKTHGCVTDNWPYNKMTGEKLSYGATGPEVVNYYQRKKLTKLLRFSCDIRDKDGLIIHHKGEDVPPRERIKKWGPGTNYEIVEAVKKTQNKTRKVSDNANLYP
jgi:hypothetical protein